MIIVDTALEARAEANNPIRIGIFGAGFMTQGLVNQIVHSVPGMRVVAVSNRQPERAVRVFEYAGIKGVGIADNSRQLDGAAERGEPVAAGDAMLLARCPHIDVLVDATGSVEYGARVALEAFANGKDV